MLKQVLIGLLTFTLLFSITGCGGEEEQIEEVQNQLQIQDNQIMDSQIEVVESVNLPTQDDLDQFESSIKDDPSLSNCDTVDNLVLKQKCITDNLFGLAIRELDTSYCDQMTNEESAELCIKAVEKRLN